MSPKQQQFASWFAGIARPVCEWYGVPVAVCVAQAALETGWGVHAPGNNHFGIKWTNGTWAKQQVLSTQEADSQGRFQTQMAVFCAYRTPEDSIDHYCRTVRFGKAYAEARRLMDSPGTGYEHIVSVARAIGGRWATDPRYSEKVVQIIGQIWPQIGA